MNNEFVVTPYGVSGEVDYDVLIQRFGTKRIDEPLLKRISKYGPLHHMLRRELFYSHRDLEWILDEYDKGNRFALYTGRGPSGPIHLGHLMPWTFTKYLQDVFKVNLWFQLTDDEKFMFYDHLTLEDTKRWGYENALDIIALGFDQKLTKIFLDTEYIKTMYPLAIRAAKKINFSTIKAVFGFDNSNNIGSIFFTSIQTVPCFLESLEKGKKVPCLRLVLCSKKPSNLISKSLWSSTRLTARMPGLKKCWMKSIISSLIWKRMRKTWIFRSCTQLAAMALPKRLWKSRARI